MTNKISRCKICGKFLNSKRELKRHKDKNHRISAPKIVAGMTKIATLNSSKTKTTLLSENTTLNEDNDSTTSDR
jgi:hypothetical protein